MNENEPLISIGLPVFNGGKYIKEALDTALNQTYTNFELIISDNGSTDGTQSICVEYSARDNRIKYIRQPENKGAAWNFKFVLEQSVGARFAWIACDDYRDKNWLEFLAKNIGEAAVVFGNYCFVGEQIIRAPKGYKRNNHVKFFLDSSETGKNFFVYGLFNKAYLSNANFDYFDILIGGDQVFLLDLLSRGDFKVINGPAMYYRLHSQSDSVARVLKYGNLWARLVSIFPIRFYVKSLAATPIKYRYKLFCCIPIKYLVEQFAQYKKIIKLILNPDEKIKRWIK